MLVPARIATTSPSFAHAPGIESHGVATWLGSLARELDLLPAIGVLGIVVDWTNRRKL